MVSTDASTLLTDLINIVKPLCQKGWIIDDFIAEESEYLGKESIRIFLTRPVTKADKPADKEEINIKIKKAMSPPNTDVESDTDTDKPTPKELTEKTSTDSTSSPSPPPKSKAVLNPPLPVKEDGA